jgi:hypothetical protein
MRNPDKYECTPRDPNNEFGGCQECDRAGLPCDRRELAADQRRREELRTGAMTAWHREVASNEDVRSARNTQYVDPPIQMHGRCVAPFDA